ncbi:hypothetical protein HPO96_36900 [Kribbella sandramycini]|uniref:Uncharacterized protein n=1 Tax=Kribbella sandramycini TaxID=60450 RepID=A0A7Y4L7N8_9ACTN|nr:hypothetical protein [Kribbella sandramycini]MBB6570243.1 hypothetical protein [Kribbella sandramycini]NOL45838.1 hypothetical protein [Kribbella sandramycini]
MGTFEDRLLERLVQEHGESLTQPPPSPARGRRRRVAVVSGFIGVAAATAAVVYLVGAGTPAYAVSRTADGVTVRISDLDALDAANAELRRLGVPVVAVPRTTDCRETFVTSSNDSTGDTVADPVGAGSEVTASIQGLPVGSTVVIAAEQEGDRVLLSLAKPVRGKIPGCLATLPTVPGGSVVSPRTPTTAGR